MHRYAIGKRLTAEQAARAIARLEAYKKEWGDYESFGDDGHKVQRVVDSLTSFIDLNQALPAGSFTEEESDAMMLSDACDVADQ